jgi:hypothetical protein
MFAHHCLLPYIGTKRKYLQRPSRVNLRSQRLFRNRKAKDQHAYARFSIIVHVIIGNASRKGNQHNVSRAGVKAAGQSEKKRKKKDGWQRFQDGARMNACLIDEM